MSIHKTDLSSYVKSLLQAYLETVVTDWDIKKVYGVEVNQVYQVKVDVSQYYVKLMIRKPIDTTEHRRFLKTKYLSKRILVETSVPMVEVLDVRIDPIILKDPPITIFSSMILKQLPGTLLDVEWGNMTDNEKKAVAEQFANYLREINGVEVDQFGDGIGSTAPTLNQSWPEYQLDKTKIHVQKLKSMAGITLPPNLLDQAWHFLKSNKELWDYSGSPKLIHKDLWAGNILVEKRETWKISGFLDWEWSMGGDPFLDLLWIEDEIFCGDPLSISKFYEIMEINPNDPELILRKRVYDITECISTCAVGYNFHNPTKEGFKRMEEILIKQIEDPNQ